jgi:hypothetical protein
MRTPVVVVERAGERQQKISEKKVAVGGRFRRDRNGRQRLKLFHSQSALLEFIDIHIQSYEGSTR